MIPFRTANSAAMKVHAALVMESILHLGLVHVALSNPTSDDIEVHICHNTGINNENTLISFLEIFVQ